MSGKQISLFKSLPEQELQSYITQLQAVKAASRGVFDAATVSAYTSAIQGLEAKQAALLLSTQGLTNAQIAEVLAVNKSNAAKNYQAMADAGLLAQKQKLTVAQVQENLQTVLGSEADAKAAMAAMGLSMATAEEGNQVVKLTAKKIKAAVESRKLTEAEAQELAMRTGVTFSMKAQATSTLPAWIASLKNATKAVWAQVKATAVWMATNPVGQITAIIAGISAIAFGFDKAAKLAKKESDEALEAYERTREKTQANREEAQSLDDLIKKYEELKAASSMDSDTRSEIKEIQYEIMELAGAEAMNLDLVNGSLDEQLEKLKEIRREKAEQNAEDAKDNYYKTVQTMDGLKGNHDEYGNDASVSEEEIHEFLGISYDVMKGAYTDAEGNVFRWADMLGSFREQFGDIIRDSNNLLSRDIVVDTGDISDIGEKIRRLEELKEFLGDMGLRKSSLYTGVADSITYYEEQYGKELEAARNLADSVISDLYHSDEKLADISVDSVETFEQYRQGMIDAAKSDETIGEALADGTLSEEALETAVNNFMSTAEGFSEWYEQWKNGMEGDVPAPQISFTDTISQIQSLSEGLDQLDKIYADVCDGKEFDWSSILNNEEFEKVFGGFTEEYDRFIRTVSDSPADIGACQSAFDSLATAYINSTGALDGLTAETGDAAVALLEHMGIANAAEIVDARLAAQQMYLKLDTDEATDSIYGQINGLLEHSETSDIARAALYELVAQARVFSDTGLGVDGKIKELGKLAEAFGVTADAASYSQQYLDAARFAGHYGGKDAAEEVADGMSSRIQDEIAGKLRSLGTSYSGGSATRSARDKAKSGPKSAEKETRETYNWIDRLLETLSEKTERIADAFRKAFSIGSAQEKYAQYLAQIESEINANNQAMSAYQQKLDSIGLSYEWIMKIQSGAFSIEDVTDENLKNQISEYRKWYDKIEECHDNIRSLEEERLKAQAEYADKVIESHDRETEAIQRVIDRRKALVELKETFGGSASAKDIGIQQDSVSAQIARTVEQNRELEGLVSTTEYGSDAWKTYDDRIQENRESIAGLTQTLAELAQELMNLPADRYERFLEKTGKRNELYEAALGNAGKGMRARRLLRKEMSVVRRNNAKAQETAQETSRNLSDAGNAFSGAADSDRSRASSDARKERVTQYHDQVTAYVKAGRQIPASLVTALAENGFSGLAKAAADYNAALAVDETAQAAAKLAAQTSQTEMKALAQQKAGLASERYEDYVSRNDTKNELYDAEAANATSAKKENSIINKQMSLVEKNNAKARQTADLAGYNLDAAKDFITDAKKRDSRGKTKEQKKEISALYKNVQKYVKSGKEIPASLMTKLAESGYEMLYQSAVNYNAYLEAYKAAEQVAELSAETAKRQLAEYAQAKFDNIQAEYERKQGVISHKAGILSAGMDLSEQKGLLASRNWYEKLSAYEKKNNQSLAQELEKLKADLDASMENGDIEKYSDEWWEMTDAINATTEALAQSDVTLQEYLNDLRQVEFDTFDYIQKQISRLTSEADFYIGSMSNLAMKDDGGLNDHGLTAAGLHYQNYDTYMKQADDYAAEIRRINAMLTENPYDTKLTEQMQEYQDAQRECIKNAEDEKKAIADLVKEGYESLIGALRKSINKYKELIQNAKDAHDYQNTVSEQSENIASLRKQLAAYSGMTRNEETAAKIQTLNRELADAEKDMQETMYDRYISDTQDALDGMLSELEEFVNGLYNNIEQLFRDGVEQVKGSTDTINATLTGLSQDYGTALSDSIRMVWNENYYNPEQGFSLILGKMDALIAASDAQAAQAAGDIQAAQERPAPETPQEKASLSSSGNAVERDGKTDTGSLSQAAGTASRKQKAEDFIRGHVKKPARKYDEYSDVNKAVWKNMAGIYSGDGKVMTADSMKELAGILGVKYDNASKTGNLYRELKELGIKGYAKGSRSIPHDQMALTQEEGTEVILSDGSLLVPLGQGDMVFTNEMSKRLYEISQSHTPEELRAMLGIDTMSVMPAPVNTMGSMPVNINESGNTGDVHITIDGINLPNVTNYEEFRDSLIKDMRFEKAVECMGVGRFNRNHHPGDKLKYIRH